MKPEKVETQGEDMKGLDFGVETQEGEERYQFASEAKQSKRVEYNEGIELEKPRNEDVMNRKQDESRWKRATVKKKRKDYVSL